LGSIDGEVQEVFDLVSDPECRVSLAAAAAAESWQIAWARLLADAGGSFPDYRERSRTTDALGRKPG
jgi:hypothetical protein